MRKLRESKSRRSRSSLPSGRRVLLYCGGQRTEPQYLEGLIRLRDDPAVTVKVQIRAVDPLRLVRAAFVHFTNNRADFDEVWCVSDVDEFEVGPAQELADRHGVAPVLSRPCFEYWLVLHHLECRRPGMTATQAVVLLKRAVPTYDKTRLRFADFESGIEAAVERAKRHIDPDIPEPADPSTGMWRLVESVFPQEQKEER